MDILGTLFGSQARVKILRLFLLNPLEAYDAQLVSEKSKVNLVLTRREINLLKKIGLITEKSFMKGIPPKRGSKKPPAKKRVQGFQLKNDFPLLQQLKSLVISETPLNRDEIVKRLRGAGKVKFLALSGVFIDEPEARIDLFLVGDSMKRRVIEQALRSIEAEVGKELSYGVMETAEFLYRVGVYDKFVRDILDYRHDRVIDKLGVV